MTVRWIWKRAPRQSPDSQQIDCQESCTRQRWCTLGISETSLRMASSKDAVAIAVRSVHLYCSVMWPSIMKDNYALQTLFFFLNNEKQKFHMKSKMKSRRFFSDNRQSDRLHCSMAHVGNKTENNGFTNCPAVACAMTISCVQQTHGSLLHFYVKSNTF